MSQKSDTKNGKTKKKILREKLDVILDAVKETNKIATFTKTSDCLSLRQLENYIDGIYAGEELENIIDHIASCSYCRKMLVEMHRAIEEKAKDEHLSPDQKVSYVIGRFLGSEESSENLHLMTCDLCRDDIQKLTDDINKRMIAISSRFYTVLTRRSRFARVGKAAAPAEKRRRIYTNEAFRGEIYKDGHIIILSLATESEVVIGKFVEVGFPSVKSMDYDAEVMQWKQEGPEKIISSEPINSDGRIEIEIAETKLELDNKDDIEFLDRIFEEIVLVIFDYEKK